MSAAKPQFKRFNPMPPAPTLNVYRVRLGGVVEGQQTMNTFYYDDGMPVGSATTASLTELFNAFTGAGGVTTAYDAAVSSDWTFSNLTIDCPTSPTLAASVVSPLVAGTGPAGHEPNQVAVTLAKTTAWKGQHGRGRISLPAVPTVWVSQTLLINTVAIGALVTKMKQALTGASHTFTPGLLSRATPPSTTLGYMPLTNVVIRTVLGSCRRRKPGVGK
jgi:hypothetical protein